jgi:hypothetical protein
LRRLVACSAVANDMSEVPSLLIWKVTGARANV